MPIGPGTMPAMFVFDVTGNEAVTIAVVSAMIALVPILGTLAIAMIQQYWRIREAWTIAQQNSVALHQSVLPQLAALQEESKANHAETISAINGGITRDGSGHSGVDAGGHPTD